MIQCSSFILINLLVPIALVLLPLAAVNSQISSARVSSTTLAPLITTTSKPIAPLGDSNTPATTSTRATGEIPTTTAPEATTEDSTTTGEVLLSKNEFVDFTEAPTLLFDAISNSTNNDTATTTPEPKNTATTILPTINETASNTTVAAAPTISPSVVITTTTTDRNGSTTAAPEPESGDTVEGDSETGSGDEDESNGGGLSSDTKDPQQPYEPPKNVSQYMDYIERLFHDLRHQITDLFEPHIPQLIRTSQMVQLSGSCSYDMLRMALALRQFEPWALRMIDSSGKVPEGIFEGSFTALGSYDECISTVFASKSADQEQQSTKPTQGKYCLVNVSPFLPPKPPADKVELMFQEEANRRNYTKDDQFSRLSPMFYYMKFRIGVCVPSTCIDSDLESISGALSSSLRLNITIPHCRIKQSQPITNHQMVGGLVFALVFSLVCGATLMDYWRRKLDRLERHERLLVLGSVGTHQHNPKASKLSPINPPPTATVIWHQQKHCDVLVDSAKSTPEITSSCRATEMAACSQNQEQHPTPSVVKFNQRLDNHWSWMSFSFLTNYKLYFRSNSKPIPISSEDKRTDAVESGEPSAMIVRCLNGIRVISLCWVIIANSYITLDPRATKRLTKTREAPKDFLFQLVAQASLAIETFFFLSGVLLSLSFARQLKPEDQGKKDEKSGRKRAPYFVQWIRFYVHRYVRMTPATMLVIAFTMFAFRYGDGPLWFEATHKAHQSCSENWWRHLLHVANFIDTRSMCFIHYWYIAADMQLFLFAPILMFLLYRNRRIGYALTALIGCISIGSVFYTTYSRNLPPTLLFYNSDPESRREFGNTIMTKPLTHALPYMVGMLVGKWLTSGQVTCRLSNVAVAAAKAQAHERRGNGSLRTLIGLLATLVALAEVFLPYKWNNSHLPTRFLASLYASLFRLSWSLVLAYLVISCAHKRGKRCPDAQQQRKRRQSDQSCPTCQSQTQTQTRSRSKVIDGREVFMDNGLAITEITRREQISFTKVDSLCFCGYGGNLVNRLLSLNVFAHLSRLSFVAYLIHLPLMSVFIAQTRGLFAFSHTLVIHLALSYLVMTFILSFILVHIIEFPFITFERYLFKKLFFNNNGSTTATTTTTTTTTKSHQPRESSDQQNQPESKVLPQLVMMANGDSAKQWTVSGVKRFNLDGHHQQTDLHHRQIVKTMDDNEDYKMSERL